MNRRPLALATASSAIALASTVLPQAPASAEDPAVDPLDAALDQALAAHPAPVGEADTVTVDPATGTTAIELGGGGVAEIALPFDEPQQEVASVDAHSATFRDEASDTTATVQPLITNGVRLVLTMGSADSPTRYEFGLGDSSEAVELSLAPNGGVQVSDTSGGDLGFIAPPWAMDANGDAVPTHYELDGDTLVQVVEHEGAAYPVVADPSFQSDCGYVTCTLRFNRAKTAQARNASYLVLAAATVCGAFSGPVALLCGAAIAPAAGVIAFAAGTYYDGGDCLKIKISKATGAGWPERLKHGTYNCTDK